MSRPVVNVAASVRQRLLNLARERNEDFGLVLTKYGLERVLFRIAQSRYKNQFVLKGALLFELWTHERYRPTRDADFLAHGSNAPKRFSAFFKELCVTKVPDDGLVFDSSSVTAERITEDADYQGVRVKFVGYLEDARIPIQIDIGFGDAVTPDPVETEIPTLLDQPAPRLLTYPKESVVAEKFEATVSLGVANSRMKDLHDVRTLRNRFPFDGTLLSTAIANTFKARGTALPTGRPLIFTKEFFDDLDKKKQWAAFCHRNKGWVEEISLETCCGEIEVFLSPVLDSTKRGGPFPRRWSPGNGWI
jgi:hypothetical protein